MAFSIEYSSLDRLFHRIAFSSPAVQLTAADIENTAFRSVFADFSAARPIFVTSLPRAGTTLALEALNLFPSLASHSYRDMPFVMAPVLWSRVSGAFQKRSELRERAHGDGMQVGYDSPEAFEEVIWQALLPEKYAGSRLQLWTENDVNEDARTFFIEHMQKIIALRRPERREDGRYISKNNGNMARLQMLGSLFEGASVVVPVRSPLEHAFSLLRQHQNFLQMHASEPFVRRYMADIGHFEFGELHRPIDFPLLEELTSGRDPESIDYWLAYWIAAFEHVLEQRDKVTVFSYEAACSDGLKTLSLLCEQLGIPDEGALTRAAALFNSPPQRADGVECDPTLRERAKQLHAALVST